MSIVILLLLLCFSTAFAGNSADREARVVRVGYFPLAGFQQINKEGIRYGYSYEYLQTISQYNGWKYEYVDCSFDEARQLLAAGKIDLLGSMQYSTARDRVYDYANVQSGFSSACLYTREDDNELAFEDYESFDGLKVGLLAGSARNEGLLPYAEENGFSYTATTYDTQEALLSALNNSEVDAILLSDIRRSDGLRAIAIYDSLPFYYTVTEGNTELLDELNMALHEIKALNPYYDEGLHEKYFKLTYEYSHNFTRAEKELLASGQKVVVAYNPDYYPFEYRDKDGEFRGAIADIFALLTEQTGLQFDFISGNSFEESMEMFKRGEAQVLASVMLGYDWAENYDAYLTSAFLRVPLEHFCLHHKDNPQTVALPFGFYSQDTIEKISGDAEVIFMDSIRSCIVAIENAQVDYTILGSYSTEYYVQDEDYHRYNFHHLVNSEETVSMAVKRDFPVLLSVLNKSLANISEHEFQQVIYNNAFVDSEISLNRIILDYPLQSFAAIFLIFVLTLIAFLMVANAKRKQGEAIEELRFRAEKDVLTKLDNRYSFIQKLPKLLADYPDKQFVIAVFDIDRFKVINDLLGYEEGNRLLCYIAKELQAFVNSHDGICCRLETDHFALCIPYTEMNITGLKMVSMSAIAEYGMLNEMTLPVGLYVIDDPTQSVELMLDWASMAQKTIKGNAVQHFAYYKNSFRENLLLEQEISGMMAEALEKKQFEIFLQPQINHRTHEIVGAEALARWIHPEKGMISPGVFVPIFEKNMSITQVDEYVWERTCQTLQRWMNEGKTLVPLSVNISRYDTFDAGLGQKILNLTKKYGIPPEYLRLEITESAYVENSGQLVESIIELQRNGFVVEMDDFGSGYSSLNTLKDVPVDVLKLDMKFLTDNENRGRGGNILNSIVRMARWLQLSVIAEGVETLEQADFLSSIGCHVLQGYFYSRPIPVADFEKMVECKPVSEDANNMKILISNKWFEFWDHRSFDSMLFNFFPGGAVIFEYDGQHIELLRVNHNYLQMTRTSLDNLQYMEVDPIERILEQDRAIVYGALNRAVETDQVVEFIVHRISSGEDQQVIWLKMKVQVVGRNDDRTILFGSIEELTD